MIFYSNQKHNQQKNPQLRSCQWSICFHIIFEYRSIYGVDFIEQRTSWPLTSCHFCITSHVAKNSLRSKSNKKRSLCQSSAKYISLRVIINSLNMAHDQMYIAPNKDQIHYPILSDSSETNLLNITPWQYMPNIIVISVV